MVSKFAKLAKSRSTESPSYPVAVAASPTPPPAVSSPVVQSAPAAPEVPRVRPEPTASRAAPPVAPPTDTENAKVPFGSYMTLGDDARLKLLMRKSGKNKVRLLSEALALLFAKYGNLMNEPG